MILFLTKNFRIAISLIVISFGTAYGQTSYTFTTATATGHLGPTQAMVNTAYSGTNLAGNVTVTGGIQYWTVPTSGLYKIVAKGAQGGGANGGLGASIEGEFMLTSGQVIRILVGQQGITQTGQANSVGGGGGSFVILNPASSTSDILVIAGGGGGSASSSYAATSNGSAGNNGNNGSIDAGVSNPDGLGGSSGNGGNKSVSGCSLDRGSGGGGFLTNGGSICQSVGVGDGGSSFLNGGQGGTGFGPGASGGFGGGGATWQTGFRGSGGGGGYSGGGAGQINSDSPNHAGGGGGSFNAGMNPLNLAGINAGDGQVIITSLQTFPNDAGISQFIGFAPPYCKGPKTVQVQVQNYGNNMLNNVTVGWSVNGVNQTPLTITQPIDTNNSVAGNTLTVTLGTTNISGPTTLLAWTYSPNSTTDSSPGNDSSSITMQPFSVSAAIPFPTLICNGDMNGIAQPTLSNATGSTTYLWSNGSTGTNLLGVGAGSYYVIATNGNCMDTSNTVIISQPPAIVASPSITNPTCFGSSTGNCVLSVTGGTPNYTVNWPGQGTGFIISNLAAGNYNFTVTDANGCNITNSITVTQPPQLVATGVVSNVTGTNNGAIDVSVNGGTPGYTYSWNNSATTEDLTNLAPGTYTVTVTDLYGCTTVQQFTVLSVVGLNDESMEMGLTIFPNPTSGTFSVNLSNSYERIDLEIYDLFGKKIVDMKQVEPNITLNLFESEGVYLVKVISGNNYGITKMILRK